jgi:aryl-alcohol dehydrogenase-like predicted oxidoreductase
MQTWTFRDGRTVHRMGFGAMRLTGQPGNWGPYPDRARAGKVFRRALELGVDFFDTAISYGAGHSEMLIAELLHPYPADLLIATKGGNVKTGPGALHRDGSPANMRRSCEASLGYLRVEVIRRIGLCNVTVEQIRRAQRIAPIESVQNKYNLDARESQAVLDYCASQHIAFIPWGPLGAHAFAQGAPLADSGSRLQSLASRLAVTPGQLALAWLLAQGPHVIPIPGTTSVEHLEENVAARDVLLPPEVLGALAPA